MIEVGQDEYFLARAQWFEGKKLLSFRSIELVKICSLEYNFFVAWKHFEGFELSIGWATKKDRLWSHQSLGHNEEKNFSFYLDDTKGWIKKLHPFRKDKQKLLAFGMASGLFCMTFSRSLLSSPILIIVQVFPLSKGTHLNWIWIQIKNAANSICIEIVLLLVRISIWLNNLAIK